MIKYIKIVPRMAVQFLLEENEFAINKVLYGDTKTPWGLISIFGVADKEGANGYREHNTLVTPDKITIFQKTIEAKCGSPDEMDIRVEIQKVVRHEIAHHFGTTDEELRKKGLY